MATKKTASEKKATAMKTLIASSPMTVGIALAVEHEKREAAFTFCRKMYDSWQTAHKEQFIAKGGCSKCGGRGWVVTWDTMDSMSGCYAEYGECPNKECTKETRAMTGLDLSYDNIYDNNRGVAVQRLREKDAAYVNLVKPWMDVVNGIDKKIKELKEKSEITAGSEVIVTKGRKVPIGLRGFVAAFSHSQWGTKALIKQVSDKASLKDRNVPGEWVATSNLDVVMAPLETLRDH